MEQSGRNLVGSSHQPIPILGTPNLELRLWFVEMVPVGERGAEPHLSGVWTGRGGGQTGIPFWLLSSRYRFPISLTAPVCVLAKAGQCK